MNDRIPYAFFIFACKTAVQEESVKFETSKEQNRIVFFHMDQPVMPVFIFAWLLAFSISELESMFSKLKDFELWFIKVFAIEFISAGGYLMFRWFL